MTHSSGTFWKSCKMLTLARCGKSSVQRMMSAIFSPYPLEVSMPPQLFQNPKNTFTGFPKVSGVCHYQWNHWWDLNVLWVEGLRPREVSSHRESAEDGVSICPLQPKPVVFRCWASIQPTEPQGWEENTARPQCCVLHPPNLILTTNRRE